MSKKGKSKGKARRDGHHGQGQEAEGAPPIDAGQVAMRLNSTAIHLVRRLHREDAALGQSSTRLSALSVLVFGGPRTLGQLAEAEGVTAPSMTRLVTAMETDGLVERSRSESDGRLVIISATTRGAELLHRGRDQRVEVLAGLLRELPEADQRCLEGAAGILETVLRPARRT